MLVAPPNMGEGPTALGRGDDPGRVDLGDRRGPHILGGETGYMRAPAVRRHASVGRGGPTGLPVGARRPSDWAMAEGRRTHCGPGPSLGGRGKGEMGCICPSVVSCQTAVWAMWARWKNNWQTHIARIGRLLSYGWAYSPWDPKFLLFVYTNEDSCQLYEVIWHDFSPAKTHLICN